jgi:hypothetical protein
MYNAFMRQDKKEEIEQWRDRIEYMARFIDSKAVDQVQLARERETTNDPSSFEKMLQERFGRGLGLFNKVDQIKSERVPVEKLGKQLQQADDMRIVKRR